MDGHHRQWSHSFLRQMLAAIGQVLACIRSITIDVNKMANSD